MLSIAVGPAYGAQSATGDLQKLLTSSPQMYYEWLATPVTRMVLLALEEACVGRTPAIGLQITDYAQAVGEVAGFQKAVIAIRNPEDFLEARGVATKAQPSPLPAAGYAAPEPPPAT